MTEREIEKVLKAKSKSTPFYEKYILFKKRLLNNEYEFWASGFPHGNNHGPGHINRVLDNLDRLIGNNVAKRDALTAYELFLAMMAILYHDVGILRDRAGHADRSAKFIEDESDAYFDQRDLRIIKAAIVSHSSSKDIEEECTEFSDIELVGGYKVRPRRVAALVRLADELDEDFRRGDPKVASKMGIGEGSKFFWRFNQRILSVTPNPQSREIYIGVKFEPEDLGAIVELSGRKRSFFAAFAEKIAKINHERIVVNEFLPEVLKYTRLLVSVKPIAGHPRLRRPRDFVFNDSTAASEFATSLPEFSRDPFNDAIKAVLDQIRRGDLDQAGLGLQRLEDILEDLHVDAQLRTQWNWACVWSLRAQKWSPKSEERQQDLDRGVEYARKWYEIGVGGAWSELGMTPENEVFKITKDPDIKFLYEARTPNIKDILGANQRFLIHTSGLGAGGCIPAGMAIETPNGSMLIEDLEAEMTILSADIDQKNCRIPTKVVRVYRSNECECICVNHRLMFTPSQPLYIGNGSWRLARDLEPGRKIETAGGHLLTVLSVQRIKNDFEVFTLTTDHPSHNFLVSGVICQNKTKV